MKYRITYIVNSDYCSLKPSDTECQRSLTVEAEDKYKAVLKVHEQFGLLPIKGGTAHPCNIFPEIWTVDNLT